MSSAKFDRMARAEIIDKIGSVYLFFGQISGQHFGQTTKQKA
jgi:hypothetical protein